MHVSTYERYKCTDGSDGTHLLHLRVHGNTICRYVEYSVHYKDMYICM